MKRVIILVVCLLFCFVFKPIEATAGVIALTEDDIVGEVGTAYTGSIELVLGTEIPEKKWDYQDSITFKKGITLADVKTFFTPKPLPTGLDVTGIKLAEDFSTMTISIAGTIDNGFDNTGYIDDPENPSVNLIQMSINPEYLDKYYETEPLTLSSTFSTGKYQIAKYYFTVLYDTQGIGTAPEDEEVQKGNYATKPEDISYEGYTFEGWYTESECNNLFDFDNTRILEDTTLYAKWVEIVEEPIVEEPTYVPTFIIPKTGID